jgi:hypothetical protein
MANHEKPVINGIQVDLASLRTICHKCRPDICKDRHSCCTKYAPHVSPAELERIVGCFPIIGRYAGGIEEGNGYKNVFEEWGDATYRIDANDDELCVFAYALSSGEKLCALHSAALDLKIPPAELKPKACSLWPLTLSDGALPELSVDKRWHRFPCNTISEDTLHLDAGVINIIASVFGLSFLEKLI